MLVGPTGTGKSVITNNFLMQLPKEKCVNSPPSPHPPTHALVSTALTSHAHAHRYIPINIGFSARTSANQTQETVMAKLDRY